MQIAETSAKIDLIKRDQDRTLSLEEFYKELNKIAKKDEIELIEKNCKSMQEQIATIQGFQKKQKKEIKKEAKNLTIYIQEELKKRGRQRRDSDDDEYGEEENSFFDLKGYRE